MNSAARASRLRRAQLVTALDRARRRRAWYLATRERADARLVEIAADLARITDQLERWDAEAEG